MTEVLAALLLLVPMLLGLAAIAQFQAEAASATQAARLLALGGVLVGRSLRSDELLARAPSLLVVNPLQAPAPWRGSLTRRAEPAAAADATRVLGVALAPAEIIAGRRLPLERNGWLGAEVQLPVQPPPWLQELLGVAPIMVSARMTLLGEDFQAIGRSEVLQRTAALDAMQPMRRTLRALRPLTSLLQVFDPPFRGPCARQPDPDVLPADRLSILVQSPAGCP